MRRPKLFNLLIMTFVVVNALLLAALGAGFVSVTYLSGNESKLIQRNLPVVEQARQLAAQSETISQTLLDVEQAESPERLQVAVKTLDELVRSAGDKRNALLSLDGESAPSPASRRHSSALATGWRVSKNARPGSGASPGPPRKDAPSPKAPSPNFGF